MTGSVKALTRIATATSVIRTRKEHVARVEKNGGEIAELRDRARAAAAEMNAVADELEGLIEAR